MTTLDLSDPVWLAQAFAKMDACIRHNCAEEGCSHLDDAVHAPRGDGRAVEYGDGADEY